MKLNKYILNICTSSLLLLFVVHICPKPFLHAMCTNHTHSTVSKTQVNVATVSSSTVTCLLGHSEFAAPFIEIQNYSEGLHTVAFKCFSSPLHQLFYNKNTPVHTLRGPPVLT